MGPIELLRADFTDTLLVGNRPILIGPPGCGKTSMIESICEDLGRKLVTIIPALADPTDINGFPVPNRETRVGRGGRTYPVIEFAPRRSFIELNEHPGGGVLFFSELTGAPPAVQSSVLRVMTDGVAGDYALNPDVAIAADANPPDEAANGQELALPMVNRLDFFTFPVYLEEDVAAAPTVKPRGTMNPQVVNEWCDNVVSWWGDMDKFWRCSRNVLGVTVETKHMVRSLQLIADFLRRRPELWHAPSDSSVCGWPSARSWSRAARHLALSFARGHQSLAAVRRVGAAVGPAAALEFQAYASQSDLPDPEEVLANAASWRFSGRPDVDHSVMVAVASAVCANPSAARVLAVLEIAARSSDRGGGPVREAAMVALRPLRSLLDAGGPQYKKITAGMSAGERAEYERTVNQATRKFSDLSDLITK